MAQKTIADLLNLSKHYDDYVHPQVMRGLNWATRPTKFPAVLKPQTPPVSDETARLVGKATLGSLGLGGLASLLLARDNGAADDLYGIDDDDMATIPN